MTDQFYEKEARQKILNGAEKLYKAVKTTMGPKGRNVIIKRNDGELHVTHDGVTVARSVKLRDPYERAGAEFILQACEKLLKEVGDGTTTVAVITYHLMKAFFDKLDDDETVNPMILAREIEEASQSVLKYLESKRLPADDLETLTKIATLSAAEEEVGRVVADTIHKIGATGTVTVEPDSRPGTTAEIISGVVVSHGYATPYMVTDTAKMQAIYEKVAVIIVEQPIHSFLEILPLLNKVADDGFKDLVVIAEDFEGDTLDTFVLNNRQGTIRTLAVLAPSFERHKRQLLDDLAVATGATVIAHDTVPIKDAGPEVCGTAERVVASYDKTVFTGTPGDIEARVKELEAQIKSTSDEFETERLEQRIALLTGKVAVVKVGGMTESEVGERKDRVDDAVAATKAALLEGILPGGGVTLYQSPVAGNTDGAEILKDVLKQPFKQLMENSGLNVDGIKAKDNMGINVKTGKLVDLVKEGIVDPFAVTKHALMAAVSLGVIGMTAGALIVEADEEEE